VILVLISALLVYLGIIARVKKEVSYNEKNDIGYKVYLKENKFYEDKFLKENMQYVASLISSVNTKFNYEVHSEKNLDYKYTYNIVGDLVIYDINDSSKILYTKQYNLLDSKTENLSSNNIVINEDLDIDYDEYNNYVNSYKRDYGISAGSKLIVTMNINVNGSNNKIQKKLNHKNKLQIEIPLSEQTLNINIASDKINNKERLFTLTGPVITNKFIFVIGLLLLIISLISLIISIWKFTAYKKENIYIITLNKRIIK